MYSKLVENFPAGYKPSTSQVTLLTQIEQAFDNGYKFVVCCAPTGSGKSFISKTIGNVSPSPSEEFIEKITSYKAFKKNEEDIKICNEEPPSGTFVLTITKSLQKSV